MQIWIEHVLIAFDEFWNAVLGGNPHETISSRAYRATLKGRTWACVLCRLLDYLQKDHCKKSHQHVIEIDHVL